jgi:hypothetical protein
VLSAPYVRSPQAARRCTAAPGGCGRYRHQGAQTRLVSTPSRGGHAGARRPALCGPGLRRGGGSLAHRGALWRSAHAADAEGRSGAVTRFRVDPAALCCARFGARPQCGHGGLRLMLKADGRPPTHASASTPRLDLATAHASHTAQHHCQVASLGWGWGASTSRALGRVPVKDVQGQAAAPCPPGGHRARASASRPARPGQRQRSGTSEADVMGRVRRWAAQELASGQAGQIFVHSARLGPLLLQVCCRQL